jgi:hypothetical protein
LKGRTLLQYSLSFIYKYISFSIILLPSIILSVSLVSQTLFLPSLFSFSVYFTLQFTHTHTHHLHIIIIITTTITTLLLATNFSPPPWRGEVGGGGGWWDGGGGGGGDGECVLCVCV